MARILLPHLPPCRELIGRYYDTEGIPTKHVRAAEAKAKKGKQLEKKVAQEEEKIPSCNFRWSQDEGCEVWCDAGSDGGSLYPRLISLPECVNRTRADVSQSSSCGQNYSSVGSTYVGKTATLLRLIPYERNNDRFAPRSLLVCLIVSRLASNGIQLEEVHSVEVAKKLEIELRGIFNFSMEILQLILLTMIMHLEVWLHRIGTEQSNGSCLYHEKDDEFIVNLHASESRKYLFVGSVSKTTSSMSLRSKRCLRFQLLN